jgi:16S rRNA (cytosine967-C5)-methyltransferase
MKLHKNLIDAVVRSLREIFNEGKYADKVIEKVLASDGRWGARDRAFVAETTYGMVRWWRLLSFIGGEQKQEINAAIDQRRGWHLFGIWHFMNGNQLPEWSEFSHIRTAEVRKLLGKAETIRKIRESIPDWMDDLCAAELGEDWDREIKALNDTAPVVVRANTLKTNKLQLGKTLAEADVETFAVPGYDDALVLKYRTNLFRNPLFKEGHFEVQDASSQKVSTFLEVAPGMRVIDACAGAGGKSLHLAALLQNKGRLIAMDVEQWKLDETRKRGRRAGVQVMEQKLIEGTKTIKRLQNSADRLLLDVPCSGLGVLKRNPDAKWKLDLAFIHKIQETQRTILESYTPMVKPGGKVVYATCSILPSEGEQQVKWFLENHPEFTLEAEHRISAANSGFDGFYMARMRKN